MLARKNALESGSVGRSASSRQDSATRRLVPTAGALLTALAVVCAAFSPAARGQCAPVEEGHVVASDGAVADSLGRAVAVDGDTAVVGAWSDDHPGKANAGSAYVFVHSGGVWSQQARLFASDAAANDFFGNAVAISGDTIVVGARLDGTTGGANAGSVYVFVRSGVVWSEQAHLVAAGGAAGDFFGNSVAIDGDTLAVGANQDDTGGGADAGSVYVYVRSGSVWAEQQHLFASDGDVGDGLGSSVAISGDTVVAGAASDDTPAGSNAGSAYVFVRGGVVWTEQQQLLASDAGAGDEFGYAVDVSADTLIAGARFDDTIAGTNAGSAYVFVRGGGVWTEQRHMIAGDGAEFDVFGSSVAVSGETVVVAAAADDTPAGADAGSAYVFVRNGTGWAERSQLTASDAESGDFFGQSVALSGNTAVVGAYLDDTGGGADAGSAYILTLNCACAPCDTNCDGTTNPFDIGPFLGLLSAPPATPCGPCAGDANGDGSLNPFDISAFLVCIS